MSNFCALTGLCGTLTEDFDVSSTIMCSNMDGKICNILGTNKHTYLVISDGIDCEHVKVTCDENGKLVTERGVGWTDLNNWPKGTKFKFDWTNEAWADAYDCQLEEDDDGEECPDIKLDGSVYKFDGLDEDGQKCYVSDESKTLEFSDGKYNFKLTGVCHEKEPVDPSTVPDAGTYKNATIVWDGCRIVSIKEGSKVTVGGCRICGCDPCEEHEGDTGEV